MKICKNLMLIFIFVFFQFNIKPSYSQYLNLSEWQQEGDKQGRIEHIVFVPVKKNNVLNISDEKYSQEIAYYFYKKGFKATPASAILFQDSLNYYILNSRIERSLFSNNLNLNTTIVFLVYVDEINLDRFLLGLNSVHSNQLKNLIMNSSVNSASNLDVRMIKSTENDEIVFTDILNQTFEIREGLNIDYSSKHTPNLSLDRIEVPYEVSPNEVFDVNFVVKNLTTNDIAFSKSYNMSFRFDKDSRFFVSDTWLSTRVALLVEEGLIEDEKSRLFSTKFKAPILPGEYKDTINVYNNNIKLTQKEFIIRVKDIGQKVLRIKNVIFALSVRKEPSANSEEINKVGSGIEFIYLEEKNGFYKIILPDGNTGWVSSRYVDIIKK